MIQLKPTAGTRQHGNTRNCISCQCVGWPTAKLLHWSRNRCVCGGGGWVGSRCEATALSCSGPKLPHALAPPHSGQGSTVMATAEQGGVTLVCTWCVHRSMRGSWSSPRPEAMTWAHLFQAGFLVCSLVTSGACVQPGDLMMRAVLVATGVYYCADQREDCHCSSSSKLVTSQTPTKLFRACCYTLFCRWAEAKKVSWGHCKGAGCCAGQLGWLAHVLAV